MDGAANNILITGALSLITLAINSYLQNIVRRSQRTAMC